MENLILEALRATEKIRNRDFLKTLGKTPLNLRDFECFLEEYSRILGLTLDPFNGPNQQVFKNNTYSPRHSKNNNIYKIEINGLYPKLIYNLFKNEDSTIEFIYKSLYEARSNTKDPYIKLLTKYLINFFYGYSCALTNIKYRSPNISISVSEFYKNLPSSVISWDTDVLFTNNKEEAISYLESYGLEYYVENISEIFFIDRKSYIYCDEKNNIVDRSGFMKIHHS